MVMGKTFKFPKTMRNKSEYQSRTGNGDYGRNKTAKGPFSRQIPNYFFPPFYFCIFENVHSKTNQNEQIELFVLSTYIPITAKGWRNDTSVNSMGRSQRGPRSHPQSLHQEAQVT